MNGPHDENDLGGAEPQRVALAFVLRKLDELEGELADGPVDQEDLAEELDRMRQGIAHLTTRPPGRPSALDEIAKLTVWLLDHGHGARLAAKTAADAAIDVAEDYVDHARMLAEKVRFRDQKIEILARWITSYVPGEPSRSEGAIDTAIRVLGSYQTRLMEAKALLGLATEPEVLVVKGGRWEEGVKRWLEQVAASITPLTAKTDTLDDALQAIGKAETYRGDAYLGAPNSPERQVEELRELRRSIDALGAVILVASQVEIDGVPLKDTTKPMGPDYVREAQFVKAVREEFE